MDESSTVGTRLLVAVVVAFLAWWPFILGFFVAFVVATDCLVGCGGNPRPLLGALIGVLPSLVAAAVLAMVPWVAGRPEHCRTTFLVSVVVVPLVMVAVVAVS